MALTKHDLRQLKEVISTEITSQLSTQLAAQDQRLRLDLRDALAQQSQDIKRDRRNKNSCSAYLDRGVCFFYHSSKIPFLGQSERIQGLLLVVSRYALAAKWDFCFILKRKDSEGF
ncbi:MAG: hypothetical protein AAB448_00925 [Patescibacteria group bacterium]